jgi:hypothetical protein
MSSQARKIDKVVEDGPFSRSTLYKAISEGKLVARKHGRTTVVLDEDWAAFLRSLPKLEPGASKPPRADSTAGS